MFERLKNYFSFYSIRNLSLLSFSQFVELVTGILYSVLVVRFLGGVVYGQLLVVISTAKILDQLLHLKVEKPLTSTLRKALDESRHDSFHRQNTAATLLTVISSASGLLVLAAGGLVEYSYDFFELNWFFLATIFFTSLILRHLRNIIFTNFQAGQLFGNLSYLKIVSSLSLNFIPLAFLDYGLLGICVGYLAAEVFIALSYLLMWLSPFSKAKALLPKFRYDFGAIKSLFWESWTYYQAKLFDRVSKDFGNVIIAYFGGPKTLSIFNIGKKFFKFTVVINPALRNYLFPRLVQKWNERREEFFYTLRKYLLTSTAFNFLALLTLSLLIPYLIPFLFGPEFDRSILVFYILAPAYLISVPAGNIFREVCFATDNIRFYRTYYWITTPLFLALLPGLTSYLDHTGVALTFAIRRVVGAGIILVWLLLLHQQWNGYQNNNG